MSGRLRAFNRELLVLLLLWSWSAVLVIRTALALRNSHPVLAAQSPVPEQRVITSSTDDDSIADGALLLLSREFDDEQITVSASTAPIAPMPPVSSPRVDPLSLRGLSWLPVPTALVEGGGLPAGGAMLTVNQERHGFTLREVRGDTAIVVRKDSSWVLVLRSRNQSQPE